MGRVMDTIRLVRRWIRTRRGEDLFPRIDRRVPTVRIGNPEAEWTFAPEGLGPESTIYSFGVGTDISFDLGLIERFGAQVHAFDPTPRSLVWLEQQHPPERFTIHPWGLADYDGMASFDPPDNPAHISHSMVKRTGGTSVEVPVRRLRTTAAELGHSSIDLLKLDIEGSEYAVLEDLVSHGPPVRQLLVEFHHRWPEIGVARTSAALDLLREAGYALIHVSPGGTEYAFLT